MPLGTIAKSTLTEISCDASFSENRNCNDKPEMSVAEFTIKLLLSSLFLLVAMFSIRTISKGEMSNWSSFALNYLTVSMGLLRVNLAFYLALLFLHWLFFLQIRKFFSLAIRKFFWFNLFNCTLLAVVYFPIKYYSGDLVTGTIQSFWAIKENNLTNYLAFVIYVLSVMITTASGFLSARLNDVPLKTATRVAIYPVLLALIFGCLNIYNFKFV